jgi:hypothetical protein
MIMVESSKKDLPICSPDELVKTSEKGAIALSEEELNRVSGGDRSATVKIKFTSTTKDKVDPFLAS